ncbi:Cochaperone protein, partial [Coemansia guatemalensis]
MPSSANKLTAKKLFQQGVEAFFDDEFEQAESLCTQAIAADSTVGEYYLRRAQIRSKLDNKSMAASDAYQAVKLTANQSDQLRSYFKALYLHGKWAYELEHYDESAESLRKASTINPSHAEVKALLEKVEPLTTPEPEPEPVAAAADASENKVEAPAPKRPQVRHEWYQTDSDVILEVFIKRVQKDATTV